MAMLIRHFVLLAVLGLVAIPAAHSQTIQNVNETCIGTAQGCQGGIIPNTFYFSIANLPEASDEYSYFWDFKDGTFSTDSMPRHTFEEAGTYEVTVSYTRIAGTGYDEDRPPKMVIIDNPIVLDTEDISEFHRPNVPGMNYTGMMHLHTSQKPVTREEDPGDTVTYVVRFRNICPIGEGKAFNLDSLYFSYNPRSFVNGDTSIAAYGTISIGDHDSRNEGTGSNLRQILAWDVSDMQLEDSVSFFISLEVKSGLNVGDPVDVEAFVTKSNGDTLSIQDCEAAPSVTAVEDIAFSHDPNIDVVSQELICPGYVPDYLDYTIHFQNTGAGPADKVEVTVWFDDHMDLSQLDVGNAKVGYTSFNGVDLNVEVFNGYAVWTFEGSRILLGTGMPYLHPTQYPYTKGFINFRVGFARDPMPCSAIYNRASIVFDCNPPVHTTPSIVRVGCDSIEQCSDCPEIIYTAQESVPQTFDNFPFVGKERFPAQRYPAAPGFLVTGRKLLYQNGTEACLRAILDVEVEDCHVEIENRTASDGNCNASELVRLRATNGTAPYLWQDCRFSGTGRDFELEYPPGTYSIAVTDADGCIGEIDFTVPYPNSVQYVVTLDTASETGTIAVAGGQPPYDIVINTVPLDDGVFVFPIAEDTNNTEEVQVKITDGTGCPTEGVETY